MNRKQATNRNLSLIGGLSLGAGLMYLLDPERGARRRSLARDKVVSALAKTEDAVETTARDLGNRTRGMVAVMRSRARNEPIPDAVLEERVREKIGRLVSHPSSIEVMADRGVVTLSGPILAREVGRLLETVSSMREVTGLENRLEVHETPGDVPGLQGAPRRREPRFELMQQNWSPTARLLVGTAGGALAYFGMQRRDLPGVALSALGLGLLARGVTNKEVSRLVGVGAGRRAVDFHKTININAPVESVFEFWRNYDNFPKFMSHLRSVEDKGQGRSHWVAAGPGGVPVEWDAEITKLEPNRILAWKSVPGSPVENAGIIHFDPNDGGTRVDIRMSYNPPAGAVGHVAASLLGSDPMRAMNDDLVRFKSLIESGRTTAHGRTVTRREVAG